MGISFYSSRVVLNTLGVVDFGIYNVVGGVVVVFSFLSNTLSNVASRFIAFEIGKKKQNKIIRVFNSSIFIHIVLAIIIFILAETIGIWFVNNKLIIPENRFSSAKIVYQFSVLSSIITFLQIPYHGIIIAYEKMKAFAYISIMEAILKLIIVFMISMASFDKLILYSVLLFISSFIITITYWIYCIKNFEVCKIQLKIDIPIIKSILSYSVWDLYGNLSVVVRSQGISILLNLFFGSIINAATGIALQVQNTINWFSDNFLTAIRPHIIKTYASNEMQKLQILVIQTSKFSYFLVLIISLPIIIENRFILSFWLKNVPTYTVIFSQIGVINSLISVIFSPILFSVQATGNIRTLSIINGSISILVLPISYFFLTNGYSPIAPFMLNIILLIIGWMINMFIIKKIIYSFSAIDFFKKSIFVCIYITSFVVILPLLFHYNMDEGWKRFFIVCLSSLLLVILAVYLLVLNMEMRSKVNYKIKQIIKINF